MIYPMMIKVDFQSVKEVGKNPKGLFVTWVVSWLIKPFTMYGFASLFLGVLSSMRTSAMLSEKCNCNLLFGGVRFHPFDDGM